MISTIYTIGYSKTPAEEFFEKLKAHRIRRLLDVRLHRDSQLAGFAKRSHLPYFLKESTADRSHYTINRWTPELWKRSVPKILLPSP